MFGQWKETGEHRRNPHGHHRQKPERKLEPCSCEAAKLPALTDRGTATERETDSHRNKRETDRQGEREKREDRQRERQTETEEERVIETEKVKQTDTEGVRDRQRERKK